MSNSFRLPSGHPPPQSGAYAPQSRAAAGRRNPFRGLMWPKPPASAAESSRAPANPAPAPVPPKRGRFGHAKGQAALWSAPASLARIIAEAGKRLLGEARRRFGFQWSAKPAVARIGVLRTVPGRVFPSPSLGEAATENDSGTHAPHSKAAAPREVPGEEPLVFEKIAAMDAATLFSRNLLDPSSHLGEASGVRCVSTAV